MTGTEENGGAVILVVDDNETTASFVAEILSDAGYVPEVLHNGQATVERFALGGVSLVILDVMLPDMDGLEVARRMKAIAPADFYVPVIMLSALAGEDDKIRGLEFADDYVTKPFSRVELLARIRTFLRIGRMHRELAVSRRLYQSLHDQAPFMYLSLDTDLKVRSCNLAFVRAVGKKSEEIVGKTINSFFSEDESFALRAFVADSAEESEDIREARFRLQGSPQAGSIDVSVRATHTGATDPVDPPIVVVLQDITRKIRLEEEQKIARIQLYRSARLTSLGMLASGVAHELNNPLTAILGFSSALLERVKEDRTVPAAELDEYLGIIHTETLRCRDVVEALSGFALDREGKISDVSLLDCVTSAIRLLLPRANKFRLRIENRISEDIYVKADSSRLGQALVNVLTNAIDFCISGAVVTIDAGPAPGGRKEFALLRVSDNGPGIGADVLPRVFDPFFTTKEVGRGTGLGLTMCHSIMKDIGGNIDVISRPGEGTVVVFEIPRAQIA